MDLPLEVKDARGKKVVATLETDEGVFPTTAEGLAKLRPVFAKDGTVTAGNASPLTDGAAAVLLMSEDKARALGYKPLAAFRSWSYVGVDPADQLLIGPAIAMPRLRAACGSATATGEPSHSISPSSACNTP